MNPKQKLLAAMKSPRAGGSFRRTVMSSDGVVEIQEYCFASGMASLRWKHEYRKRFVVEVIHDWVERVHPAVSNELFRVAMESNTILPSQRPA